MLHYIIVLLVTILSSCYLFPIEFAFLPGVNTKMVLALAGLMLLFVRLSQRRSSALSKDILLVSFYALIVSFISFLSITFNETHDYTYVTYAISIIVWLVAAYCLLMIIRAVHGSVSVELVCIYLIVVCVFQCVSALVIDAVPSIKMIVATNIPSMRPARMETVMEANRMFGLGAAFDPAGIRFAATLIIIGYLLTRKNTKIRTLFYLGAFVVITVVGNMIARTTTVGAVLGVAYVVAFFFTKEKELIAYKLMLLKKILVVLVVMLPIIVYQYNHNRDFQSNLRFGFEGFFSLVETGEWRVSSTEVLKNMVVFPDNTKTWIVGDGYMRNPYERDPYYTGPNWAGFYKQTDIGYLRFLFYSGLVGLISMCVFIYTSFYICFKSFPEYRKMFLLLLLANILIWLKVTTDIFQIFALFIAFQLVVDKKKLICVQE